MKMGMGIATRKGRNKIQKPIRADL